MLLGTEALELEILYGIKNFFECDFLNSVMPIFSCIGNGGFVWILAAVALLCTKKYRRGGVLVIVGLLVGVVVGNLILKNLIARPRPFEGLEGIQLLIEAPKDWSFPSGHTLSSFVAAFLIYHTNKRLGILAVVLAAMIAFSRMYLFVHYPSDILGGLTLAWVIACGIIRISQRNKR